MVCLCVCVCLCRLCIILFGFCNLLPRFVRFHSVFILLYGMPLRHSSIIHIDFFFYIFAAHFPPPAGVAAAVNLSNIIRVVCALAASLLFHFNSHVSNGQNTKGKW